jgi:thiamine-monophosphate kinase
MKTLADIGERELIDRFRRRLSPQDDVIVGVGDDCAVVRPSAALDHDLLLTSDPVIEGVHFGKDDRMSAVGHKVVARTLSDIAAMGGEPSWLLIDIVAPRDTCVDRLEDFHAGAIETARKYGMALVGGDVSEGTALEAHAFAVGSVPRNKAVLRSEAKPGDALFVTGRLGGSRQGRHLSFEPRVVEGIWLRDWASAMIDLSDGLATDLRHLVDASGTGALFHASQVPVAEEAALAGDELTPLQHALRDGEDFELLLALPVGRADSFASRWSERFDLTCTRIGEMTASAGTIECFEANGAKSLLESPGFEHFSRHGPGDDRAEG